MDLSSPAGSPQRDKDTGSPPRIWLSPPHMDGLERRFVAEAFDTNWIAPLGPHVDGFEADLQRYTGAAHAAALSSGTAALHLALLLLGVGAGDEVICQAMTFSASANPVTYLGATPVFVDSETDTWNMCPGLLDRAIAGRLRQGVMPRAIIVVHLYGMPAKMHAIRAVAGRYGIPVVEDAAEALGATLDGKRCGTFGELAILSFNGNKIITTGGGGALLSDNAAWVERARFFANQARDAAPHYQHSHIGYNYRMSNVLAAIGRGQMTVLDERVAARRDNFRRYQQCFDTLRARGYHIDVQQEPPGYLSNRWLTAMLIDRTKNKGINREQLRLALQAQNIESRPLWKPMQLQPVFAGMPFYGNGTSQQLFEHGLCLPSGSNLTAEDFQRITDVLNRVFR